MNEAVIKLRELGWNHDVSNTRPFALVQRDGCFLICIQKAEVPLVAGC